MRLFFYSFPENVRIMEKGNGKKLEPGEVVSSLGLHPDHTRTL